VESEAKHPWWQAGVRGPLLGNLCPSGSMDISTRMCLLLSILQDWHTRQPTRLCARFPQAEVESEQYMDMPKGFDVGGKHRSSHVLKLLKNIYGGRASSRIWVEHLRKGLEGMGFTRPVADPCVFYRDKLIFLHFVDDCICLSPDAADIDKFLSDLRHAKFNVADEGELADYYLGVKIEKLPEGKFKLSQPHLIDSILEDLSLDQPNALEKPTPALSSSKIIHRDLEGAPFNERWEYRSVIGKLNFLEKSTRLQTDWEQQTSLSMAQRDMTTPCLLHFNLSLPATVQWIAGPQISYTS
jgi:hypothetical protein